MFVRFFIRVHLRKLFEENDLGLSRTGLFLTDGANKKTRNGTGESGLRVLRTKNKIGLRLSKNTKKYQLRVGANLSSLQLTN